MAEYFWSSTDKLFIQQRKEFIEILVDWETKNKYAVLNSAHQELGFVAERGGGFWAVLSRWFLRSHRPLQVDVFDHAKQIVLHLSRPFFWFFSDLHVSQNNQKLGSLHRRFGILYKKYDLYDEHHQIFARVQSPLWRLWTFPVLDHTGQRRAVITKKWQGVLAESFTDADMFMVDFGHHPWTASQRAVLFAASISIDFDFFENNQGVRNGIFDLFS